MSSETIEKSDEFRESELGVFNFWSKKELSTTTIVNSRGKYWKFYWFREGSQARSWWDFQQITDWCKAVNSGAVNNTRGKEVKQKIVSFYRHVGFSILDVELNDLNNFEEQPYADPDNSQELSEPDHENEDPKIDNEQCSKWNLNLCSHSCIH